VFLDFILSVYLPDKITIIMNLKNSFLSKLSTIAFVFLLSVTFFSCGKNKSDAKGFENETTNKTSDKNRNGEFDFLPTSTTNEIVVHQYYTLSYSEKHEQAEWVAHELKKEFLNHNHFERPYFIDDPKVEDGSASWKNYKHSGYDKGHLCPAADMGFDIKAFDDTFFTSNISPQLHDFNDGIWNNLEQKTRYWARKYDGIYVVTGGVLTNDLETIGNENVSVPKYFYKILLDDSRDEYKMIAFLVPNEASDEPLYKFVVSVDKIEQMTGIDFFPKLDDEIENRLEKAADYKGWSF
jgi:endonuclease G, mitochondrial